MTSRAFLLTAFFVFLSTVFCARAEGIPATEKTKIEALLTHIEGLTDAKFIRNETDYDSKSAAKFLRGKWQAHEKAIKSAADFIAIAATRSSTSGKPYMIRLKDSAPTPCADYLTAQLKKFESAKGQ